MGIFLHMANAIPTDTLCAEPPPLADERENAYKPVFHGTVFDAENRLVSAQTSTNLPASVPRKKVEFAYDYMSRRVGKSAYAWSTNSESWLLTSDTSFLYDSWNLVSEICDIQSEITTNWWCWGLDLSGSLSGAGGIGGLLSARYGTNDVVFSYDANGNVSELISNNGAIAAHYEYSPFGETTVATGPLAKANPFRFSTKYFADELGLGDWGYRWYGPSLARWLSRDPIGEHAFLKLVLIDARTLRQLQGEHSLREVNEYEIVANNGISHWDYLGLEMQNNGCACNDAPLQRYCLSEGAGCGAKEASATCKTRSMRGNISPAGSGGIPFGWDQCICMSPAKEIWVSFPYLFFWREYCKMTVSLGQGPGEKKYYDVVTMGKCQSCCPSGVTCIKYEELGYSWNDPNN